MQTLLARDVQSCLGLALPVSQRRREPEEHAWQVFRARPTSDHHGPHHFLSILWLELRQMGRPNCHVGTVVQRRDRPLSLVFFITFKYIRQLHVSTCPPEGCTQICHSSCVTLLILRGSLGYMATLGGLFITLWSRQAQRVGQMGGQYRGEYTRFCLSDTTVSEFHHTDGGRGRRSEVHTDGLCDLGQVSGLNLLTYLHQLVDS